MTSLWHRFLSWALGPQCPHCLEWKRGPRTLAVHLEVDHAGDER